MGLNFCRETRLHGIWYKQRSNQPDQLQVGHSIRPFILVLDSENAGHISVDDTGELFFREMNVPMIKPVRWWSLINAP